MNTLCENIFIWWIISVRLRSALRDMSARARRVWRVRNAGSRTCKPHFVHSIHQPKTKFNTKSHWTRMPQILSNNLHGKWNAKNIVCPPRPFYVCRSYTWPQRVPLAEKVEWMTKECPFAKLWEKCRLRKFVSPSSFSSSAIDIRHNIRHPFVM